MAHGGRLAVNEAFQRLAQILQEVPAIGHWRRLRCSCGAAARILRGPIRAHHLNRRMRRKPGGEGWGGAILPKSQGTTVFEIHNDRPGGLALALGEVIHPDHPGQARRQSRPGTDTPPERARARGQATPLAHARARIASARDAKGVQRLTKAPGRARVGRNEIGQTFRKDPTRTGALGTAETPHAQNDLDRERAPGEVAQGPPIATVDATRLSLAERARDETLEATYRQRQHLPLHHTALDAQRHRRHERYRKVMSLCVHPLHCTRIRQPSCTKSAEAPDEGVHLTFVQVIPSTLASPGTIRAEVPCHFRHASQDRPPRGRLVKE